MVVCGKCLSARALIETHWELPANRDLGNDDSIGLDQVGGSKVIHTLLFDLRVDFFPHRPFSFDSIECLLYKLFLKTRCQSSPLSSL